MRSRFQVDPIDIGDGKHAEDLPEFPLPLTPLGPSDILIEGIFNRSILWVCHESKPLMRVTFSSKVRS